MIRFMGVVNIVPKRMELYCMMVLINIFYIFVWFLRPWFRNLIVILCTILLHLPFQFIGFNIKQCQQFSLVSPISSLIRMHCKGKKQQTLTFYSVITISDGLGKLTKFNAITILHISLSLAHKESYFWQQIILNTFRSTVRTSQYNSHCHILAMSSQYVLTEQFK
jgi:hypothetical protein